MILEIPIAYCTCLAICCYFFHFSVVDTIIHRSYWNFLKSLIIVPRPREACSYDIILGVEMLVILPHISHWLGNRRIHFLSRSRDQAENKASSKEESCRG